MQTTRTMQFLLVEADTLYATHIKRALTELGVAERLVHVRSAEAALAYLAAKPADQALLALVDMDTSDKSGCNLVSVMKSDEAWRCIPIIVMTASHESLDVQESFNYSIAGYLVKPHDCTQMMETVRVVANYWALSRMPACA
jgi:CheY-like chemotaxis protein